MEYNNATGRSYPHRAHLPAHPHIQPDPPVFSDADLNSVLADYGETLDIGRDDLAVIIRELLAKKAGGPS